MTIDYGQTGTAAPAGRVTFTVAERCLPVAGGETCATLTAANASAWPDVPQSQICDAATCTQASPTFFTRKRLTQVTTSTTSGASLVEVDRWTLAQQFPAPGDGYAAALWLASIQHAAAGGANPDPVTTFGGVQLANRVDGITSDKWQFGGPQVKWRVATVNETGGLFTRATYSAAVVVTAWFGPVVTV